MKYLVVFLLGLQLSWSQANTDSITIKKMFDYTLTQGEAHDWLRSLTKDVGHRLSGSPEAEKAVQWSKTLMEKQGFDRVYLQEVMVPHWVRGEKEKAHYTLNNQDYDLTITALGGSVATPSNGIEAPVIEVSSLDDLKSRGDQVKGKIVFINQKMDPTYINTFRAYGECGVIRYNGAKIAGPMGALAVITRSLTTEIDDFAHTGMMSYGDTPENQKIPTASISTLDSEALSKAIASNKTVTMYFKQSCKTLPDALSYNVIGEIKGSQYPDQIITVGGHLDSWDVGEGAHDDGAGVVQSLQVLKIYKALNMKPKHTLRVVFFMNEENGVRGGKKYAEEASAKGENHIMAMESDSGGHTPRGFSIMSKDAEAVKTFKGWEEILAPYGLRDLKEGYAGTDIHPLDEKFNIVLTGLNPDSQRYFDYHHTDNDVFEKVNRRELLMGAASMAAMVYLFDQENYNQ